MSHVSKDYLGMIGATPARYTMKFCPKTKGLCEHSHCTDLKADLFSCLLAGECTEKLDKCPKEAA